MAYQKGRYGLSADNLNAIWKQWDRIGHSKREILFESFDSFAKWSAEEGYDYGMRLRLKDEALPLSPENCRWEDAPLCARAETERKMLAKQWNTFIRPYRRAACRAGMNPCLYCEKNSTCNAICIYRAAYWDAEMERLRRLLK